jgi:hypothetical protein
VGIIQTRLTFSPHDEDCGINVCNHINISQQLVALRVFLCSSPIAWACSCCLLFVPSFDGTPCLAKSRLGKLRALVWRAFEGFPHANNILCITIKILPSHSHRQIFTNGLQRQPLVHYQRRYRCCSSCLLYCPRCQRERAE